VGETHFVGGEPEQASNQKSAGSITPCVTLSIAVRSHQSGVIGTSGEMRVPGEDCQVLETRGGSEEKKYRAGTSVG